MFDKDFLQEVWQTVISQKWRSLMTAFGVFWGIFMLVILIGTGMGLNNGLLGGLKILPTNSIIIAANETEVPYGGFPRGRRWQMKNVDFDVLTSKMGEAVENVACLNYAGRGLPQKVNTGSQVGEYMVAGVTPSYYYAMPHKLVAGRYVNDIDITEKRKVCVIGLTAAKQLFPEDSTYIGKNVVISDVPWEIVGVCVNPNKTISIGIDPGESFLLPISTQQLAYNTTGNVDIGVILLKDEYPVSEYKSRIISMMKQRHTIAPEDDDALVVLDLSEQIVQFDNLFKGIDMLIWIIGIGTLIAGLVGISNIMLITVKERTKEFGIRRALGASPNKILMQILSESLFLTATAGVAGMCVGVWLLSLLNIALEQQASPDTMFRNPCMPFGAAIGALIVIILGGVLAGAIPARRALKIKAIEALAEE